MRGSAHDRVRVRQHVFAQCAIEWSAERAALRLLIERATLPESCKYRADAIPLSPLADLAAARDHLACGVGANHERQFLARIVLAPHHHQIARIERHGAHADQDLPRAAARYRSIFDGQVLDAEAAFETHDLHRSITRESRAPVKPGEPAHRASASAKSAVVSPRR